MTALIKGTLAAAGLSAALATAGGAQTVAITNGTIYPVSSAKIDRGTVVIQNGRITAVGANVAVPAGATVIDASGKVVTPGFIHAEARAGGGVAGLFTLGETARQGEVTPSFNPRLGLDPGAITIPVARTGGVTTGIVSPGGNFLPGQSLAINFSGDDIEAMVVRSPVALDLDLSSSSRSAGGNSRAGAIERLRQLFADATEYDRRRAEYRRDAMQDLSAPVAELEALLPALKGQLPVLITANRAMDIENALRIVREFRLRAILAGGVEAWKVADKIAAARIPVVVDPTTDIPSFDGLGARLDNATLLREAGISVILAGGDPGGERNLRFKAGNAVRNGMTWDDALKAVTQWPAEAFGLDQLGTLAAGKAANLVIWSGDPFEPANWAERVLIGGVETSLRTRENELRDRYRTLPPTR
ncbi:MAG: amidohydrolase family protein [Gemmatimonadales bacterium]